MYAAIKKYRYILVPLLMAWGAYEVGMAIGGGESQRAIFALGALAALGLVLYFIEKIGEFPLFCLLVFLFWLPFDLRLYRIFPQLIEVHPTEIGIWFLSLWIIINNKVIRKSNGKSLKIFAAMPWLLFITGALVSNIFIGRFSDTTLRTLRTTCLMPLILSFLSFYYIRTVKRAEQVLWVYLISGVILGLIVLYSPMYVQEAVTSSKIELYFETLEKGRLTKFIDLPLLDPILFSGETGGISFAFMATVALSFWLYDHSPLRRRLSAVLTAFFLYIVVQSEGRSALLALVASFGTIGILGFINRDTLIKSNVNIGIKLGGGMIFFLGLLIYKLSIGSQILQNRFLPILYDPMSLHGLSERVDHWIDSVEVLSEHPFFGVGLYGFPNTISGASWYAHNLYLYLLLSFGVMGFVGFLILMIYYGKAIWYGLYSREGKKFCVAGASCIAAILAAGVSSCYFGDIWNILAFWIPVTAAAAAARVKEAPPDSRVLVHSRTEIR
jgi:O-antigen ligase